MAASSSNRYSWQATESWEREQEAVAQLSRGEYRIGDLNDPFARFNITPVHAGEMLCEYLVDLKHSGSLRASHACIIAFWAELAGAVGPISELAYRPDSDSGKFSAHFDLKTGAKMSAEHFYHVDTSMFSRTDGLRVVRP